ncbi:CyP450 monooxygenase [Panus rudis PR-1116 ss-1]|nr:CyP450 monooxygenase [Panus rudis PR-1116 ss-1]
MLLLILSGLFFLAIFISNRRWRTQGRLPLPPGPKGYPIIGNLLDLPTLTPWKTFRDWTNVYGDLVYLDLPMRPTIILGSAKAAYDLLEKRSDIYSDRHVSVMIDLSGWEFNVGLMHYSQRWRAHRRAFQQYFNIRAYQQWKPIQLEEIRLFLRRLLDNPAGVEQDTRLLLSTIILRIVYGMNVTSTGDDFLRIVYESVRGMSEAGVYGAYWVDYVPVLQYLPDWFPGTRYRKVASKIRKTVDEMRTRPINDLMERMETDSVESCVASALISKAREHCQTPDEWAIQDDIITNITGITYAAGVETTNVAVQFFYIAMCLFPEVQKAAQAELDTVVGSNRLPTFDDQDNLVYIRAVVMESVRWQLVIPSGVAHRSTRDDEYDGYFIPAGTEVIPNAWAMLHDPEEYPDPHAFKPERYIKDGRINPDVRDPSTIAFGFGRRICAGRHMATSTLYLIITSVLHTFDIDFQDGESFDPETMILTGITSAPAKVPCVVRPRSRDAEQLVRCSA